MKQIAAYKDVSISSEALGASPWQQINMLLKKLDQDLTAAHYALENQDVVLKCKKLANANKIVIYLQDCLKTNVQPDLTLRLNNIYSHLQKLIFKANAKQELNKIAEAKKITENLITWWTNVNAD